MRIFLVVTVLLFPTVASAAGDHWTTSDRLNRRTCPDSSCGIVGQLFFRENANVFETKGGWARVTKYYNARCVNGKSEYVDSGDKKCVATNGIEDGLFAEWVSLKYLSTTRPADPSQNATGDELLIKGSDDFAKFKTAFAKSARNLINSGTCKAADFKEMGGWMKSSNQKDRPIYFTYCGGMHRNNRIYLDASTGRTFK